MSLQSTLIFIGVSEYPLGSILVYTLLEFNIFHLFFFGSLDHLKQFTVCENKLAILVGRDRDHRHSKNKQSLYSLRIG